MMAVVVFGVIGVASQINAQAGDNGVTASPKWQQFLKERGAPMDKNASKSIPATTHQVGYQAVGDDGIAASPKYRQLLNEEYGQVNAQLNAPEVASSRSVGYRATGDDGITASPKLRQMLDEQARGQTQIAQVK